MKTLPKINVEISSAKWPFVKEKVAEFIADVLFYLKKSEYEVSVYIVGSSKMKKLHREFFNDPSDTDCISFSQYEGTRVKASRLLGDVFVCWNQVCKQAKQYNQKPKEELYYCIIHGILHLLGYDDVEPEAKKKMFLMQDRIFCHLVKNK